MNKKKPYFLWDYDLTEEDVRRILHGENEWEKKWITARILESARYEDVWKYLKHKEIKEIFPSLKLKKPIQAAWERALYAWN